jgi:hypothetical protein
MRGAPRYFRGRSSDLTGFKGEDRQQQSLHRPNVEVNGATRPYRVASVLTAGLEGYGRVSRRTDIGTGFSGTKAISA